MFIVCILTQYAGVFQENLCDGQIFLTFFDKTKSQKRCEEMLGEPSGKPVPVILPYCISCLMIPDDLSCILFTPISASVYAHIRV